MNRKEPDWPHEQIGPRIIVGHIYRYVADWPAGCKGHKYRVCQFFPDVPSYQEKVLVEALTGPDKGLHFVVSLWNFATRYAADTSKLPSAEPAPSLEAASEKIVDLTSKGKF